MKLTFFLRSCTGLSSSTNLFFLQMMHYKEFFFSWTYAVCFFKLLFLRNLQHKCDFFLSWTDAICRFITPIIRVWFERFLLFMNWSNMIFQLRFSTWCWIQVFAFTKASNQIVKKLAVDILKLKLIYDVKSNCDFGRTYYRYIRYAS